MPTVQERIGILETKVENFDEKLDDIKDEVRLNHNDIKEHLDTMYKASCTQHANLDKKISEIEQFKDRWTYTLMGGVAVLGWVSGHIDTIKSFFH